MSESDKSSHWDSLASDLGAEPAGPPPPPPTAPPPVAHPKAEKPASAPSEPAAPRTDWKSLANLLGIATTPEAEAEDTTKAAEVAPTEAFPPVTPSSVDNESKPSKPPKFAEKPQRDKPQAEEITSTWEEVSADSERETSADDSPFGSFAKTDKKEDADLPDDLLPRKIEPTAAEKAVGDLFGIPSDIREVAPAEERRPRDLQQRFRDDFDPDEEETSETKDSGEQGEFGAGLGTDAGDEEEAPTRKRRRRRRRGRKGRGDRETAGEETSSSSTDDTSDDLVSESTSSEGTDSEDSSASDEARDGEEAKPGRRRRRRRGRRGRKKEGTQGSKVGENGSEGVDEFDDDDQFDSPNDIPLGGGDDSDEGDSRTGHRNIPTWDEAIGIMISVNMEARAKSPGGGRSGPPRGRGRGRGKRS